MSESDQGGRRGAGVTVDVPHDSIARALQAQYRGRRRADPDTGVFPAVTAEVTPDRVVVRRESSWRRVWRGVGQLLRRARVLS